MLAITDIRMPGMSGIELADQVWKLRPGIEILLMTAYLRKIDRTLIPTYIKRTSLKSLPRSRGIYDKVKLGLSPSQLG